MHQRWLKPLLALGGWFFLGFVLSLEVYLNNRASSMPMCFVDVAIPQFGRASMWGLMAPLILRLGKRMPLRACGWAGGTSFHLGMSFVVMATYYLGRTLAYRLWFPEPGSEAHGFWEVAIRNFWGRNIIDMAYYWAV